MLCDVCCVMFVYGDVCVYGGVCVVCMLCDVWVLSGEFPSPGSEG